MELITGENDKGRRLDRILRKALPDHPLPLIHRLLRQGQVLVNGKPAKANDRIDSGAAVSIPIKDTPKPAKTPRSLPLPEIIWKGSGLIAVNKPPLLAVHGYGSLDDMVRNFLAEKLPPSLSFKPGPLHRLDKPSSGIVIFSTNIEGARLFSSLMRERKVHKTYLAIVEGKIDKEEIWEDRLARDSEKKKSFVSKSESDDGKTAITKIRPVAQEGNYSLVMAEIVTGRTHQIRAQAASHGHPLAGDRKYGSQHDSHVDSNGMGGFFLHAWKIEFLENKIEAPLPLQFKEKIKALFSNVNTDRFSD
ncbi:MAG: RluA family pseudouridine synthase [Treponema sp.]|jgi:23S rRNA pseudouridine955/2504/2580 synthase|nr:RluA family pseudouridine synthase [Treponema sp.]